MSSLLRRGKRRLAIELREALLGPQSGLRNDYSFIEAELKSPVLTGPLVSVVIPVYNRKLVLARTLAALELQQYTNFEVVVTDDGSSDNPETLVDDFPKLKLRFVRQEDEGFRVAAARNNGVNAAHGEIVAVLDADMIPAPDWLARLIPWFVAAEKVDAEVVVVGDRQFINADGLSPDDVRTQFDRIRFAPRVAAPEEVQNGGRPTADWRYRMYDDSRQLKRHIAPYAASCHGNLACTRDLWLRVGGCDESYSKWGGEDIELGYRMYRRGVYFVPERTAVAFHQDHPRSPRSPEDVEENRRFTSSRIPFNRTDGGPYEATPLTSIIVSGEGEGYEETVQSVLRQDGADFEVLVPAFLGPHGDPRVRAVKGGSFAEMLDQSRGEWVLPLRPGQKLGDAAFKRFIELSRRHAVYVETYVNRDRDQLCWTMTRTALAYRSPDRSPAGIAEFAKGRGERVILFDDSATPSEMTKAPDEPLRRLLSAIDSW